jgi:hypothetical protein
VIIDWKTSGKYKKREWIQDYFIQGAAYAHRVADLCEIAAFGSN